MCSATQEGEKAVTTKFIAPFTKKKVGVNNFSGRFSNLGLLIKNVTGLLK